MFTFGWGEIFLIVIIVVVVIGPKDLPKFIKQIGLLTKNIKKISSDFKSSINEIAEETEIKDLAKSVKEVKKIKDGINIKKNFQKEINFVNETVKDVEKNISDDEANLVKETDKNVTKNISDDESNLVEDNVNDLTNNNSDTDK
tara:strand:- start:100 stop:531 length:432 start_codon:yes stop_codon:yes gene_type:complete